MPRLNNIEDMELIYEYAKKVYAKEICANEACDRIQGKTPFSKSSLKMYFTIYASMMKGKCYKMGTSESFTKFLIESIYKEFGEQAAFRALSAAKLNADYRISCGNEQPGIEKVCREIIKDHNFNISYEALTSTADFIGDPSISATNNPTDKEIDVKISYGCIVFSAKGDLEKVISQLRSFPFRIIEETSNIMESIAKVQRDKSADIDKENEKNIADRIKEKYPEVESLQTKKDFKAKMIPLMYFANACGYKESFTIRDVQELMLDILGEESDKKTIEGVFKKKSDWFEQVSSNPRRYKLLGIVEDYVRNVLEM